jgi:hypothetical protein
MLLSAAFGFVVGDAFGHSRRHRKCLEQTNTDLRDQIGNAHDYKEPLDRALKQQRGVINDIHKQILAVTKALQKRPSYRVLRSNGHPATRCCQRCRGISLRVQEGYG